MYKGSSAEMSVPQILENVEKRLGTDIGFPNPDLGASTHAFEDLMGQDLVDPSLPV